MLHPSALVLWTMIVKGPQPVVPWYVLTPEKYSSAAVPEPDK